jgi:hypothetical protein
LLASCALGWPAIWPFAVWNSEPASAACGRYVNVRSSNDKRETPCSVMKSGRVPADVTTDGSWYGTVPSTRMTWVPPPMYRISAGPRNTTLMITSSTSGSAHS